MSTLPSRWVGVAAALIVVGTLSAEQPQRSAAVFFVRHAEKDTDDPSDPRLSEAGVARANALARMLEHSGVTHLFSSQYRRTRQTLEPLAERTGIEIEVIAAQDPEAQLEALRTLPSGAVAVVAGHSNTVPNLVCELDGRVPDLDCVESKGRLDESDYDRLYLLVLSPSGHPPLQTLSLRIPAH